MKIGVASDHLGFTLKQNLTEKLRQTGYNVVDYGCSSKEICDYPDYGFILGEAVRDGKIDYGIAICGSAIGISIACNKVKDVRCAKVSNVEEVIHGKGRDHVNVIALNGDTKINDALDMIESLILTPYEKEERYFNRIKKIEDYESGNYNGN